MSGVLLSDYSASHLPPVFGYQLLTLFLISGMLRGLVATILHRYTSEVRKVPKIKTGERLFGKPNFTDQNEDHITPPLLPFGLL